MKVGPLGQSVFSRVSVGARPPLAGTGKFEGLRLPSCAVTTTALAHGRERQVETLALLSTDLYLDGSGSVLQEI